MLGIWAVRLTGNWAYTFLDQNKQDWRYDMYKEKFPRLWHVVNFTGINQMPTIMVFLAMIPGFILIEKTASSSLQSNLWTWLGFIVCIGAVTLQVISDTQAHRFRKTHRERSVPLDCGAGRVIPITLVSSPLEQWEKIGISDKR